VLLALDVGNTNLKCALFQGQTLLHRLRTETPRAATAPALAQLLADWVAQQGVASSEIAAVIIASVVPPLTPLLSEAVRQRFAREALLVGPELATGLTLRGPNPLEVGADRLMNTLAGWSLAEQQAAAQGQAVQATVVVDLGTATKLDCVSASGEFLGGVIAPGVATSLEALVARAARLRTVELRAPAQVLGRSTSECVQSGVIHGHASLVDGLVAKLRRELACDCQVIATGGWASLIAPLTESLRQIEPDLTLHGLRLTHARSLLG
jgi:type III pantothenate kinase